MPKLPPTKRCLFAAMVLSMLFCGAAANAEDANADDAKKRATLFLAEARDIFAHDHWSITREVTGGFTAVHPASPGGPTSAHASHKFAGVLMLHASVIFTPKDIDTTDCAVKIEAFLYSRKGKDEKYTLSGPYKADYPENSDYVRELLIKAEDRLGEKHPRFRAK